MLSPEIYIGGSRVFSTAALMCQPDDEIIIYPFGPPSGTYKLVVRFENDETEKSLILNTSQPDGSQLLTLKNFAVKRPIGNSKPLYIANHNKRRAMIYFSTEIFGSGEAAKRHFIYTVFDGGPTDG